MSEQDIDYYCKNCDAYLSSVQVAEGHTHHNVIPKEWVVTCGSCFKVIEREWSFCAWCGQKFSDW